MVRFFRRCLSGRLTVKLADFADIQKTGKDLVEEVVSPVQQKVCNLEKKAEKIHSKVSKLESGLFKKVESIDDKLGILVNNSQNEKINRLENELEVIKVEHKKEIDILKAQILELKNIIDQKNPPWYK